MAPPVNTMIEPAGRAPRKPYVTASMKREAWIEKIQDRYSRKPTANELLALDNLPCASYAQLNDRSKLGVLIYERLSWFERNNDVFILEETGRLLRLQMTNAWPPATVKVDQASMPDMLTPATSVAGDQSSVVNMWKPAMSVSGSQSSQPNMWTPATSVAGDQSPMPDPSAENGSNQPLGQENEPVQAGDPNIYGSRDIPFRSSPTTTPVENSFQSVRPEPAVTSRIIRGDVYYMPITLTFNSEISHSSIAIHVPGRPTAVYPEPLTTTAQTALAEMPSGSVLGRGFAGNSIRGGL